MLRWLWRRIVGRRAHAELDAFLAVLRARGVLEYRSRGVRVVFREGGEASTAAPALDALAEAGQLAASASERGGRPPTDDELLFGQDGYGLGRPSKAAES